MHEVNLPTGKLKSSRIIQFGMTFTDSAYVERHLKSLILAR